MCAVGPNGVGARPGAARPYNSPEGRFANRPAVCASIWGSAGCSSVAEPCPAPCAGPSISGRCGGWHRAGQLWWETCLETWRRLAFNYPSSVHHSLNLARDKLSRSRIIWAFLWRRSVVVSIGCCSGEFASPDGGVAAALSVSRRTKWRRPDKIGIDSAASTSI